MGKLRYTGDVEKTLIDIAPLTPGCVIEVEDSLKDRLLASFPTQYEAVPDSTPAGNSSSPSKVKASKQKSETTEDANPGDTQTEVAQTSSVDSQPPEA